MPAARRTRSKGALARPINIYLSTHLCGKTKVDLIRQTPTTSYDHSPLCIEYFITFTLEDDDGRPKKKREGKGFFGFLLPSFFPSSFPNFHPHRTPPPPFLLLHTLFYYSIRIFVSFFTPEHFFSGIAQDECPALNDEGQWHPHANTGTWESNLSGPSEKKNQLMPESLTIEDPGRILYPLLVGPNVEDHEEEKRRIRLPFHVPWFRIPTPTRAQIPSPCLFPGWF